MPQNPLAESEHDELLATLLEQLVEASKHGKSPRIDDVIQAHPHLATELRELWATAMIAEDFGSFAGELADVTGGATLSTSDSNTPTTGPPIPRRVGDYIPIEEIGRGGMGIVYKARQTSLDRIVALKMILRGGLASAADVARFRAEAESAARLTHASVVSVYEVGEHEGMPFFSMQYIEGTTVAERLADGPFSSREAARLLVPVCRAIDDAHHQGLLHRDIKPSNILIDMDGKPFVTDFGLAKRLRNLTAEGQEDHAFPAGLTQSGAILGTPSYMAPEQAAGQRGEISPATDVYSLGALLYAMLTGRPPFQAASPVDTVFMVLEEDPLPPRVINSKVDVDLEMITLKCLQKPADLRYQTAAELADDLQAYLAHEPVKARSGKFVEIISRAFRETHHAAVLENWGLLWMWHSLVLMGLCLVTNGMLLADVKSRWPFIGLWVLGLSVWASIFWSLRRRAGPITFVERQVAHVWAGSVIASGLLYVVEAYLGMEVLQLAPILGIISGMVFLVKAGILSGAFYIQSIALFLTAAAMAFIQTSEHIPDFSISLFGVVSAVSFFVPGLKYYRQHLRSRTTRV